MVGDARTHVTAALVTGSRAEQGCSRGDGTGQIQMTFRELGSKERVEEMVRRAAAVCFK